MYNIDIPLFMNKNSYITIPKFNHSVIFGILMISTSLNTQAVENITLANSTSTNLSIGGYIKLDTMLSDYSDGNMSAKIGRDFFIPATIPTGGESGDIQFDISAKTSRFFIKTKTQTEFGDVTTHIELDFIESLQGDERFSNSYSSRLRHAYAKWTYGDSQSILAGQTWSNFFNVSALPELVDFVGPAGTIFAIQPQITFESGHFKIALENPTTTLQNGTTAVTNENNRVPDLTVSYSNQFDNISYYLALLTRELAYSNIQNSEHKQVYALSSSAKILLSNSDDLRFMISYGNGLGRYMGFNSFLDAYIDQNQNLNAIKEIGGYLALRHNWNNQWRSNIALSASRASYDEALIFNPAANYQSAHINLIYTPVKALDIGLEFIYGKKELHDDTSGTLKRLQFGFKYLF